MAHIAEQFVAAVAARLASLATTGPRVFTDRPSVYALQDDELPALRVDEAGDDVTEQFDHTIVERTLNLRVELVAKAADSASALTRTMAAEVETALLGTALTVAGREHWLEYRGSGVDEDALLERAVCVRRLAFTVTVATPAGDPQSLA